MKTYGIEFPFRDSIVGDYVRLTSTPEDEVRSNMVHLLLTKKGSRYFHPDFGTRLYEYIFDQNDSVTHSHIEDDIRNGIKKYIPNVNLNSITVTSMENENLSEVVDDNDDRVYRVSDSSTQPYTSKVRVDYTVNNGAFSTSDFIIINI